MIKISTEDWFSNEIKSLQKDVDFLVDEVMLNFTEDLLQLMEDKGMSKKELAFKLNCSPAYISKLFRGNPNFTVKKMVELALIFGRKISIPITDMKSAVSKVDNSYVVRGGSKSFQFQMNNNYRDSKQNQEIQQIDDIASTILPKLYANCG